MGFEAQDQLNYSCIPECSLTIRPLDHQNGRLPPKRQNREGSTHMLMGGGVE